MLTHHFVLSEPISLMTSQKVYHRLENKIASQVISAIGMHTMARRAVTSLAAGASFVICDQTRTRTAHHGGRLIFGRDPCRIRLFDHRGQNNNHLQFARMYVSVFHSSCMQVNVSSDDINYMVARSPC